MVNVTQEYRTESAITHLRRAEPIMKAMIAEVGYHTNTSGKEASWMTDKTPRGDILTRFGKVGDGLPQNQPSAT